MHYLITLKSKFIYYALSILVATLAAIESGRLLFLLVFFTFFLLYKREHLLHIIGVIFMGLLSFSYVTFEVNKVEKSLTLPTTLTWTHEYKINGDKLRGLMTDMEGRKVYVVYQFTTEEEKEYYQQTSLTGRQFLVYGSLEEPSKPAHQFAFNMKTYLKSKGAIGIVEISQWSYMNTKASFYQKINEQRFKLKTHIEKTFPQSLVGEAQALLIGLQDLVEDEETRAYQKLGITHLFAISGLHIAIVSFIFFQGLLRLKVRKEFATVILLIILPTYALLAGGAPSVWRAVVVVELIILCRLKWFLTIDDALSLSFLLFLLVEPWSVFQIGFQLSYLATVSLIYSGKIIQRDPSWLMQSFFITFVCQLLVYPLLLFHFYEISISSFFVNIFFVPLFSFIILPINIVLLVISFLPGPFAKLLFACYEPFRTLLTECIHWLQAIPYQMWVAGKLGLFAICLAYVSVFIVFYMLENRKRLFWVMVVLAIPVMFIHYSKQLNHDLKISFVNVGQGDCIILELPKRKAVYMIDTGGLLRFEQENWKRSHNPYEVGTQVVVPYLKGKGIQKIDKLIITHADADHVEGAEEILREINIKEIHVTPNSLQKEIMHDLLKEARKQQIPIREQIAGNSWTIDNMTFQYLWPQDTDYEGNNDSLVLFVKRNEFTALFTGDLEQEGEELILQSYPNLKNIYLLKAGHHGSKTSSSQAFVEKLSPHLTIFNAGENNRYGHPHVEVVERFKSLNLPTLTTGEKGTIEVRVNHGKMSVFYSN
ncbi:DNA internalization-related competence protein ComEC/Rec2 [Lysinibacillus sp. BW-2-10]|uniref:DNA internalization-related competence protein ComEC/Rec2 n=1 Tax=Lysinibacillus sp. BW-2-10 TaxID=2590030 RepID=UPI00117C02A2|nr:DNA internalization-related competence protein ComEC/Rec2 [Lysinibacillus sp. BW-2-10]TSI03298.1 DNA internalization-related competence protein ComEC/Rec2 [Lysinibacillus sp. BW-2-10]